MRSKYTSIHLLILWCAATLFASCSNTDCPLNNVVRCYYTIYSSQQGAPVTCNDTLSVYAADTTLLNKAVKFASFNLPMSYALSTDTLTFLFKSNQGINTTKVYVSHTNRAYFVSLDCPTTYFHNITDIKYTTGNTAPTIDSIVIIKPEVNYERTENIRIYLSDF